MGFLFVLFISGAIGSAQTIQTPRIEINGVHIETKDDMPVEWHRAPTVHLGNAHEILDAFDILKYTGGLSPEAWIARGLILASQILDQAIEKTKDSKELYSLMKKRLLEVQIIPEDPEQPICKKNVMGATIRGQDIIYVCQNLIKHRDFRVPHLAQVLVHEAAHKAGLNDECDATRAEVGVMRLSRTGLKFQNDYWEDCGIR